ncbi:putative bifunctional diguanylate cyclase/phosphodiesterase [Aureimonas pseudogalii]|uniref:Diguanylate cyclase (GGDEF)-like protein n=1 Tax=Aureimonas pseudogalii TaxID=1744844 RepID=A0A7W6ML12_9HYPH|nr:EAL domain-containing protein [Aureimonas pseudogalii]MBB3999372.1 diguanylate cyclase (GGDEF)-like protein [Aureimonas pseudogalii]
MTAVLAVLAILCSLLSVGYLRQMTQAARYNLTFDFSQSATELLRLQLALERRVNGAASDEVSLRASILANRLGVLRAGLAEPGAADLVDRLRDAMVLVRAAVDDPGDLRGARLAADELAPFVVGLLRLASQSHAGLGDEVLASQRVLTTIFAVLCLVTLGLVVFGVWLVVCVVRQNARLDLVVRIDPLTQLANRLAFNAAMQAPGRGDQGLILVDVDHFKSLNDTFGHAAGDRLLREIARRLRKACADAALIGRIGGDEFAILYEGRNADRRSQAAAARIVEVMRGDFVLDGQQIALGVTMGVALRSEHVAQSVEVLFRDADLALYAAKAEGRGRFLVYRPDMSEEHLRNQRLSEDLRHAIERLELHLLFQPIVSLETGATQGFEALLRWDHGEFGPVSPSEFIPLAERSGEIVRVGRWVIEAACRQVALWPGDPFVTVNVSAVQLVDADLVSHVAACLARHLISPSRLEIEITESTLIENDEMALRVLHELRGMGCRVALDDFGTGYASLSYLRRFPFDKIKIDRSFLPGVDERDEGGAIIAGTCNLARRLNLTIVAEGVETEDHRRLVAEAGCHLAQGYLFDRPLAPPASLARLLQEASPDRSASHETTIGPMLALAG